MIIQQLFLNTDAILIDIFDCKTIINKINELYFSPGGGGGGGRPKFRSMGDLNQPTVYGGGCPGGSCGM